MSNKHSSSFKTVARRARMFAQDEAVVMVFVMYDNDSTLDFPLNKCSFLI